MKTTVDGRRRALSVSALVLLTFAAGCASKDASPKPTPHTLNSFPQPAQSTTPTPTETSATPSDLPSITPEKSNAVTKVLVFVEENHSLGQMKDGMPYAFGMAEKYGYATNFVAIRHPSLPNYIAMAGGSTYGISNNDNPSSNKTVDGPSVFGLAIAAGKTAALFADGMNGTCATSSGGDGYAVRHNPWPYFSHERALCKQFNVGVGALDNVIASGALPNVGMVVPNPDHDAHDGSLGTADNWFRGWMTRIFNGPDWKSGHLAIVLTADEDNKKSGNLVLTVVVHPSQKGNVVTTRLSHYSLSRLLSEVAGTKPQKEAQSAPSMSDAFGLPLP